MQNEQKYIYVVLSRTSTNVAKIVRKFTKCQYSHTSISFDEQLTQCYTFGRVHYKAPLIGQLVQESYTSFTLNREKPVPVIFYRIPVSEEVYKRAYKTVSDMWEDPEYIYNLLSIITYPVQKGIDAYKSYTCIQFVMMILKQIGIPLNKPSYKYIPDDLIELLKEYKYYEGDIRGIMSEDIVDIHFLEAVQFKDHFEVVKRLYVLCKRKLQKVEEIRE